MRSPPATLIVALLASGCPQLAEDDFRAPDALAPAGGAPPFGGAGGASTAGSDPGLGGGGAAVSSGGSAAASPSDAGTNAVCARGQEGPSGACYLVLAATEAWATARVGCRANGPGWDLAMVQSSADTDFITPLLEAETWIGASDAEQEGSWFWIPTAEQFWPQADSGAAYTNWNAGEPNNVDEGDCLRLLTTGNWADLPCDTELAALCAGPP